MTCAMMLDAMLEADMGELGGHGETALARHVRECAKCRAIADQLTRDTLDLARSVRGAAAESSLESIPRRSVVRRALPAVLVGLAAALSIIAVRGSQRVRGAPPIRSVVMQPVTVSPSAVDPTIARVPLPPTPSPRAGVDRAVRPTNRPLRRGEAARAVVSVAVKVEPTLVTPVERVVAVRPVRIDPSAPRPALGGGVSVDPPVGKRANIMRTSTPGVTVVWLYE